VEKIRQFIGEKFLIIHRQVNYYPLLKMYFNRIITSAWKGITPFCGINNLLLKGMNLQNSLEIGSTQTDNNSKSTKLVSSN